MAKSPAHIVEKRIRSLASLILQGYERESELFQLINSDKRDKKGKLVFGWGIGYRQFQEYLRRARALIKEDVKPERTLEITKSHARYLDLYSKAYAKQDYKTCLRIQHEIDELYGLKQQTMIKDNIAINITMPPKPSDDLLEGDDD